MIIIVTGTHPYFIHNILKRGSEKDPHSLDIYRDQLHGLFFIVSGCPHILSDWLLIFRIT